MLWLHQFELCCLLNVNCKATNYCPWAVWAGLLLGAMVVALQCLVHRKLAAATDACVMLVEAFVLRPRADVAGCTAAYANAMQVKHQATHTRHLERKYGISTMHGSAVK